jgi:glycosyltransferase involved in cell wall biosynthesis
MTDKALVSIIIPCYQQGQYLPEAVDSALAQTYSPVEVIVVNDDSPDDTEEIARGYGDRIVYLRRPPSSAGGAACNSRQNGTGKGRGPSATRNAGIAVARGCYFKFLDADDHLHVEQIAWQMEAIGGRDDCVSLTGVRLYRDGQPEQFIDHVPRARALLPDLFKPLDWGAPIGWLLPAALVRAAGGFDERYRRAEDWDLFTRIGLLGAALKTDARIGCYYRQRPGSLSANRAAWAESQARILIDLHDKLRALNRPDWFGLDLLKFEQGTYQALVQHGVQDRAVLDGVLRGIFELQRRVGFGDFGWRFRLMARCLGYARAERLRCRVVRTFQIHPPTTLDTEEWRNAR